MRDFAVETAAWTPDDLLTPSFKLKRQDAKKKYAKQIETMLDALETVAGRTGLRQGAAVE